MQIFTHGSVATQNDISEQTKIPKKNKQKVQELFKCYVVSTQSDFKKKKKVIKIQNCGGKGRAHTH